MSKPIKINLNNWEVVENENAIEGYSGMIITPKKLVNGIQPADLYFRRGELKVPEIEDVTTAMWFKDCHISNKGSEIEYANRVDWWFDSAISDQQYKTIINDTFNRHGFDIKMSWEKAKVWLKQQNGSSRKTFIHKFIWNWLSKGMQWQLTRLEKERANG
jgi:hypothetical protein